MRALINEVTTGRFVGELSAVSGTWSTGVCVADAVSIVAAGYVGEPMYDLMIPRRYTITYVDSDRRVRASGVLSTPEAVTDPDGLHKITFPGNGVESLFEKFQVLPYPFWPLVDSMNYPIISRDTRFTGVEYGTMIKKLYQQALTHPGADLPVVWEPDRAGTREKGWEAVNGKPVQEAVREISALIGGVEWDWVPYVDEFDSLSWFLVTGTDAEPEITSSFFHAWQSGGTDPSIRNLNLKVSGEFLASEAILSGGKEDDTVMMSRAWGTSLQDAGVFPAQVWDSSHSSVSVQSTLDGWAAKALSYGQTPVQYWTFEVREEHAVSLRHGDWCSVDVLDHWLIPDGSYTMRVVQVSGTIGNPWLSVTTAGEMTW